MNERDLNRQGGVVISPLVPETFLTPRAVMEYMRAMQSAMPLEDEFRLTELRKLCRADATPGTIKIRRPSGMREGSQ